MMPQVKDSDWMNRDHRYPKIMMALSTRVHQGQLAFRQQAGPYTIYLTLAPGIGGWIYTRSQVTTNGMFVSSLSVAALDLVYDSMTEVYGDVNGDDRDSTYDLPLDAWEAVPYEEYTQLYSRYLDIMMARRWGGENL